MGFLTIWPIFYANLRSATNPYAARAEAEDHRKTDIVEAPDQAGGNHRVDRAGGQGRSRLQRRRPHLARHIGHLRARGRPCDGKIDRMEPEHGSDCRQQHESDCDAAGNELGCDAMAATL